MRPLSPTAGAAGRQLSAQDTAFLALERGGTPMNIGIVASFAGPQDLDRIALLVTERLHALEASGLRPARRRWLGARVWAEGAAPPLERITLATPGNEGLLGWFGDELSKPFGTDQALWQGWLVAGVAAGEFAVALKAHHALIDGVGGLSWWSQLFDADPSTRASAWRGRDPREPRAIQAAASVLGAGLGRSRATVLNGPLGKRRLLRACTLSVDALRALQRSSASRCSINDVLLAVAGAALEEIAGSEHDPRPLRALYPVDRRNAERAVGNQLGGMLVELAAGASLGERIASVHRQTRPTLRARHARGVEALGRSSAWMPPAATRAIFSLAGRYRVFNFVFSALRAPRGAAALAGAPLQRALAFGPLFPRVRCNLTALRRGPQVDLAVTSAGLPEAFSRELCDAVERIVGGGSAGRTESAAYRAS